MRDLFVCVITLFFFSACSQTSTDLELALHLAGENRGELEKVLTHYSEKAEDSLKYKAASYLIENMPYHLYYEGKLLDQYSGIYKMLMETQDPELVLKTFRNKYGEFSFWSLERKNDIEVISADYLIRNIEWAFKVREEQPWGKNISFENFCHYILPYRVNIEQPSNWREILYEKYNPLFEELKQKPEASDPFTAARFIVDHLCAEDKFFTAQAAHIPLATPLLLDEHRSGSCRDMADFTVYVLRALGIPAGVDFMPIHGRLNSQHCWTFMLDKEGNSYTSDYLDGVLLHSSDNLHITSKIYREQFHLNKEMSEEMNKLENSFPTLFRNPRFEDVTQEYTVNTPVTIEIPEKQWYNGKKPSIAYLCVTQYQGWTPVAWSPIKNNRVIYKNIKPDYCKIDSLNHGTPQHAFRSLPETRQTYYNDILYRIAFWESGELKFLTDPFILREYKDLEFLTAYKEKETVCIYSKFCPFTDGFVQHMVGGAFEGANNPNFTDAELLYQINEIPLRLNNDQFIQSDKAYRYVRFRGAHNTSCGIAEIALYGVENELLSGTPLTNLKNKGIKGHEYTNAFDGNPYTSFYSPNESGDWVGIDLHKPQHISHIVYTPRNRDNYIRKGDKYELFYLDKEWNSLGYQIAQADSLLFENAPVNALYYIKNHSRGNDERAFILRDGLQIFF